MGGKVVVGQTKYLLSAGLTEECHQDLGLYWVLFLLFLCEFHIILPNSSHLPPSLEPTSLTAPHITHSLHITHSPAPLQPLPAPKEKKISSWKL